MKPRGYAVGMLFPLLAACGDSPTGPDAGKQRETPVSVADLQRVWVATKAEYTSNAQPTRKVELVASGGSLTLDLSRREQYTLSSTVRYTGSASTSGFTQGTWSISGSQLTLGSFGAPVTYTVRYDGTLLTLTSAHERFALTFEDWWNDREEDVSAILVLVGR